MGQLKPFLHDLWAGLSHVPLIGDGHAGQRPEGSATWVPDEDARRLGAYRVLAAYRDNVRRYFLPADMWIDQALTEPGQPRPRLGERSPAEKYREYGDPGLLVDVGRALVLGDDQTVVLPDLVDSDPEDPALARAREVSDWLTGWSDDERLRAKLMVGEEHSVGDGDGVYVLGWSPARRRPRLRTYDPGFYFPDLLSLDTTPGWEDEYPPVVHLAWEFQDDAQTTWLRRSTWRMVRLPDPVTAPWTGPDGRPAVREWTCLTETHQWRRDALPGNATVYNLVGGTYRSETIQEPTDLQIDFLPVVHVPNDEPGMRHFGRALPMRVAQILDDLAGSDTDNALTSELIGSPPTILTGAGSPALEAGPGVRWDLPTGASAGLLDTSNALTAGIEHNDRLLHRLAINTRLALALLGQISPKDVPSGYALELGFAPARSLMREMRMVRNEKYRLLLKFATRMAQAYGVLSKGETPHAIVDLGSALPADLPSAVDTVKALLPAGGMSTETAVRMLQAAGLPIDDAEAEVARIRAQSFEDAVRLVDATGDVDAARKLLGLDEASPAADPGQPEPDPSPAPVPSTEPPAGGTA